ncbi:hypothetical protein [Chryseobacterium sp. MFBS3-17]|uniref:hypothetical protein n=1 Tax=Chryseobacterium sp. MFBS3-17 TaxID=2886689 RepID=UPI001D0F113A|nr:hypothetical protein [Chryseobacterium sp. MFBS3-17]MCC2591474.1 hypothetical protein [Chryseobacterium sp. MFBS3-17]
MKALWTIMICLMFCPSAYTQATTLTQINSSNILDYYERAQILQQNPDIKSIDIVNQTGTGNIVEMADRSPNYIELNQTGNYNTTYYVNPNSHPTNTQVNITGSGNYIDITGSNSISDGMKINVRANDMTIFVRNY